MNEFSISNRLLRVEELALKLFEKTKTQEETIMKLEDRIKALEAALNPKAVPYGLVYKTIRAMELVTAAPESDDAASLKKWEEEFIERYGTEQQFIEERTKKEF